MSVGADGFRLPNVNGGDSKHKLEVLGGPGQDEFCRTFVINDEDHTLGNALKHVMSQNPNVTFSGYTVPHPMERKIHVRIQTSKVPAVEILRQALNDLKEQNILVKSLIKQKVEEYQSRKQTEPMES